MTIHAYHSQRDLADSMPLISDAATITETEAMDERRNERIEQRIHELVDRHELPIAPLQGETIDWEALFAAAAESRPSLISQIGALHERYERRHPALLRLRFETDEPFEFVAGQYVTIRYRGMSRPYSIASAPTRDHTELCIRRVADGKLTPRLCEELSVGDRLTVRGPNGHLHLEDPSHRDIAFCATGTGIAPLKSMIDYLFDTGRDSYRGEARDIWLFLGAAWADDLPYHDAFLHLDETHEHFHYVPCVSREPWLAEWPGETEYVQDAMVKYIDKQSLDDAAFGRHIARYLGQAPAVDIDASIDPQNLEVYACGLNGMVFGLETALRRLGVSETHVHGEGYG